MSNFPPPPPFGGGFYPPQHTFPPHPPIPPPTGYGVNPQLQYMQQRPPYGQGPPLHPQNQFPASPAFNQNQFQVGQPHFPHQVSSIPNYYPYQYQNNAPQHSNGTALGFGQVPPPSQVPPPGAGFNPMQSSIAIPHSGPSQSNSTHIYPPASLQDQAQRPLQAVPTSNNSSLPSRPQSRPEQSESRSEVEKPTTAKEGSKLGNTELAVPANVSRSDPPSTDFPGRTDESARHAVPHGSNSSQPTQSQMEPTFTLPGLGTQQIEQPAGAIEFSTDGSNENKEIDRTAWLKRKAEAKAALLDLVNGGITHSQIANEGISLDVLKSLVPMASNPEKNAPKTREGSIAEPTRDRQSTDSPESGEVTDSGGDARPPIATDHRVEALPFNTEDQLQDGLPPKADDRKDYIARLLAAKQTVAKPATTGLTTSPEATSGAVATNSSSVPEPSDHAQSKDAKRQDAKDPVQTELVRKRLEALKNARNQAKLETQAVAGTQSAQPIPISGDRQGLSSSRSYSFYADNEQQLLEGLPGLSPVTLSRAADSTAFASTAAPFPFSPPPTSKSLAGQAGEGEITRSPGANLMRPSSTPGGVQRKRPSASDFIDSPPARKRRVDESDPIQVVIDVSEDEEGEILSDPERHTSTQRHYTSDGHPQRESSGLRDKPPLSNFPLEQMASRPTSQTQTPKSLSQLEAEIAAEKERIAAIVRNKKVTRPVAISGHATVPGETDSETAAKLGESQNQLEKVQHLKQQQHRSIASKQRLQEKLEAERRTHALITARAEEEQRAALTATSLGERERRLQRKAALEASLPKLDAGIESSQKRLDDIRKQQEELQVEIERELRDREAVLQEIKALMAIDLESDTEDAIVESENKLGEVPAETSEARAKEATPSPQSSADLPVAEQPSPYVSSHADDALEDEMDISGSSDEETPASPDEVRDDSIYDDSRDGRPAADESSAQVKAVSSEDSLDAASAEYDPSIQERFSDDDEQVDDAPAELGEESNLYPTSSETDQSEDYEPTPVSDLAVPEQIQGVGQAPESNPPKVEGTKSTEGNTFHEQSGIDTPGEDGEIRDEMALPDEQEPQAPTQQVNNSAATTAGNISDQMHGGLLGESGSTEVAEESMRHFTPYESPLNRFHSYRFSPQYVNTVSGGFSSLTFSHKIQTDRALCRWELAGGICNDSACDFQHFRDLPLTGNSILLELGSVHEGKSEAEQKQYVDGLRQLLASMRDRGLNDIDAVASDIVAYRSRFLNDPSRVITHV